MAFVFFSRFRQVARLVLRSRLVLSLAVLLLAVNVGTVITRTLSVAQLPPATDAQSSRDPLALLEELDLAGLIRHKAVIFLSAHERVGEGAGAVLFGDRIGHRMLTLATTSLDAVYLLVVPLVALFAGCNLLPHDRRIYGTLFSLPVRRSGFYAIHLAVLWVAIAVFFLVLFVVDLALLEVLPGAHAVPWRMLLHFQALGAAWALGFAYLGLLLGTVRRRGTALAVGLIVTILLVGVLPAAQLTANTLYAWRNFAEIERSLLEGTTPEPSLADRLQSWGQYLPGFVMAQALDSLSTRRFDDAEPAASCSTCAAAEPLARLLLRHYGSLLGYAGLLGVLGTAAFARKRESA